VRKLERRLSWEKGVKSQNQPALKQEKGECYGNDKKILPLDGRNKFWHMKRIIIPLAVLLPMTLCLTAQPEKEIRADIKHVTVFPDRAQIIREVSVTIPSGSVVLKLPSLSPFIDIQSIQVKGFGDFTILSVTHRNNYLQNLDESSDVKDIRSQIEALQMKIEDEKASMAVLKAKEDFLAANRGIFVKESTFTIEQYKSMLDLYTKNYEQVTTGNLAKERLIKDYEKQVAALQKQLSEMLGRQLPSGEISVAINSEKQGTGRLSFSYVVTNAGWYPSYDIRVNDVSNPVAIIYKANIFQKSGVDWKGIGISLSNATPSVAGNVPSLNPWFIDYYSPPVLYQASAPQAKRSKAPEMMEAAASESIDMAKESVPVSVEKRSGETTITFDVAVPATVISDGKVQTVEIQRLSAPAVYRYVTVPKLSQHAYLTANLANWEQFSLQNGEATLYFENSFVGKSYVRADQMEDTLVLSLGTDNSIVVKREKRSEFTSTKIIGSNKTETWSFLISVRNNKTIPVEITVNDQIPVSSNSGLTVEPVELSGGKLNSQTGVIKWDLSINKGDTKQLVLTYSVRYPKDKKVILE
jgi:uncharacterized protein (TIGR02231 family)